MLSAIKKFNAFINFWPELKNVPFYPIRKLPVSCDGNDAH